MFRRASQVTARDPISTAGAAVLWSGLNNELGLLHQQTLVLRPTRPMGAEVEPFMSVLAPEHAAEPPLAAD